MDQADQGVALAAQPLRQSTPWRTPTAPACRRRRASAGRVQSGCGALPAAAPALPSPSRRFTAWLVRLDQQVGRLAREIASATSWYAGVEWIPPEIRRARSSLFLTDSDLLSDNPTQLQERPCQCAGASPLEEERSNRLPQERCCVLRTWACASAVVSRSIALLSFDVGGRPHRRPDRPTAPARTTLFNCLSRLYRARAATSCGQLRSLEPSEPAPLRLRWHRRPSTSRLDTPSRARSVRQPLPNAERLLRQCAAAAERDARRARHPGESEIPRPLPRAGCGGGRACRGPPVRHAKARGVGARAGERAETPAPGRAGERPQPRGSGRARRADPRHPRTARADGASGRASHEPGDEHFRPRGGAQFRQEDRRRNARPKCRSTPR